MATSFRPARRRRSCAGAFPPCLASSRGGKGAQTSTRRRRLSARAGSGREFILALVPSGISVIIASHNTRAYLGRCLSEIGDNHEVIVVDSASTDGSQELVRTGFPRVRLIELDRNKGYGAALNEGIAEGSGDCLLLMNADAWPRPNAIERLVEFAQSEPHVGIVGPRLVNLDGTLQRSVRGFPTLWRLATEYLFLRWLAPWSRALNAFYGSRFDHRSRREAEFLVGAVLLVRRQLLDEIGRFDTSFFMFNEEVDFCYRARSAGWSVVFWPGVEFVHAGGASTSQAWSRMYREQLRSHLRFLAKHHGMREADRARKLLTVAMRIRALVFAIVGRRDRRRVSLDAARWLRSGGVNTLLRSATCRRLPAAPMVGDGCGPA
jgi:N-acetylglucosaminyl-diphospho-decaprenol L-rhamnosyltransferase